MAGAEPRPGADAAVTRPVLVQMWQGEPSPDAMWQGEPSPGADVADSKSVKWALCACEGARARGASGCHTRVGCPEIRGDDREDCCRHARLRTKEMQHATRSVQHRTTYYR